MAPFERARLSHVQSQADLQANDLHELGRSRCLDRELSYRVYLLSRLPKKLHKHDYRAPNTRYSAPEMVGKK